MGDEIGEILSAPDHYAVLGVREDCPESELRRAYLTKSVKVHPDKNSDPRATPAFQRVAEAWAVLSDDEARKEYDRSLRAPSEDDTFHYVPPPPPSFKDALFVFAAATTMMGGHSWAGDVGQTLYWAQQLVEGRQTRSPTENTANAAMAVGSGLRAVGAAAKMMGFKNAGALADRTAGLAQVVGVGAVVANVAKDNPSVRKAFEHGGEKARTLKGTWKETIERMNREKLNNAQRKS